MSMVCVIEAAAVVVGGTLLVFVVPLRCAIAIVTLVVVVVMVPNMTDGIGQM